MQTKSNKQQKANAPIRMVYTQNRNYYPQKMISKEFAKPSKFRFALAKMK
jgi:hypothetical protein